MPVALLLRAMCVTVAIIIVGWRGVLRNNFVHVCHFSLIAMCVDVNVRIVSAMMLIALVSFARLLELCLSGGGHIVFAAVNSRCFVLELAIRRVYIRESCAMPNRHRRCRCLGVSLPNRFILSCLCVRGLIIGLCVLGVVATSSVVSSLVVRCHFWCLLQMWFLLRLLLLMLQQQQRGLAAE